MKYEPYYRVWVKVTPTDWIMESACFDSADQAKPVAERLMHRLACETAVLEHHPLKGLHRKTIYIFTPKQED